MPALSDHLRADEPGAELEDPTTGVAPAEPCGGGEVVCCAPK
jgi:hypothetical protein